MNNFIKKSNISSFSTNFLILIFLMEVFVSIETKEIAHGSIADGNWVPPIFTVKTSFVLTTTTINKPNVIIAPGDESIKGLRIDYNNKIFYLPIKVGENFPNLLGYSAYSCSIKDISRANFYGLSKLKFLSLGSNRIEKIASDTFSDLTDLERLALRKNSFFLIKS